MGALIFLAVGRHPVAGLLAAIAGVGCGFTANLLIVTTDVLLSGISTEAAAAFNPQMHVSVIDNWYFMASSVVVTDDCWRPDNRQNHRATVRSMAGKQR